MLAKITAKLETKYSRENYTDSCMRNNTVKYKVESRALEATRDQDRIGESKMYTEFLGMGGGGIIKMFGMKIWREEPLWSKCFSMNDSLPV
jgi:hypothetical protein